MHDYKDAIFTAIKTRLQLLRAIYTIASEKEFMAYRSIYPILLDSYDTFLSNDAFGSHSFYMGDYLIVSPILEMGLKEGDVYSAYFPEGTFYSLSELGNKIVVENTKG